MEVKYKAKIKKDFNKLNRILNEIQNDPKMMKIAKKFIIMHSGKLH